MPAMHEFIQGSKDYLVLPVVDTTNIVLADDLPVEVSIDKGTTWLTAGWVGAAATTRSARILLDTTDMTKGVYAVWLRLADTPTRPIVVAGSFRVK